MQKLTASDLLSLEQYARERLALRARMIDHRRLRQLRIGEHCSWSFEDRDTVRYQVQEMLRTERIFEQAGIEAELGAYNPLIPDGRNLKATLLIEYEDAAQRARRLSELRGFERHCWMRVAGFDPIYAIADEDLERENDTKTSAVHFLRFEFTAQMLESLRDGGGFAAGVDHPSYRHSVDPIPQRLREALMRDFS
ncbi:MAG TPA: DUF3501 family protein [Steroidobacteraceae bacterium]|jgi:hypothetical protein|nr:DUF3501 family protein [Steroidobacteraceae bacterium]